MGLSVSAATAVVFLGLFIAAGTFIPAVTNSVERVTEARHGMTDRALDQKHTALTVSNATYYEANNTLVVTATNDGSTALELTEVDLLADNTYLRANGSVVGVDSTDIWLPGETATFEATLGAAPNRTTVVVDHGVRDWTAVVVV